MWQQHIQKYAQAMEAHMVVHPPAEYNSQAREIKWYMACTESQTTTIMLLSQNSLSLKTRNN
jgi:hypothetical protein